MLAWKTDSRCLAEEGDLFARKTNATYTVTDSWFQTRLQNFDNFTTNLLQVLKLLYTDSYAITAFRLHTPLGGMPLSVMIYAEISSPCVEM